MCTALTATEEIQKKTKKFSQSRTSRPTVCQTQEESTVPKSPMTIDCLPARQKKPHIAVPKRKRGAMAGRQRNTVQSVGSLIYFLLQSQFETSRCFSDLKAGLVTKARGSAYMECGQTKIIAAVYGPREIPRRSDFSMKGLLSCTFERTAFAKRTRKGYGPSNQEEQELSAMIGQALEATVCMVREQAVLQSKQQNC